MKRNVSQTLKKAAANKSFPSVYIIDTTCFDECFLFVVVNGRHSFLYILTVIQRFGATAMLLRSLKQLLWKKSVIYIHYLHNNITMLLLPQSSKIRFLFLNVLNNFFFLMVIFILSACEYSTFFLVNGIFET